MLTEEQEIKKAWWAFICEETKGRIWVCHNHGRTYLFLDSYGKTWLAYDYEPKGEVSK